MAYYSFASPYNLGTMGNSYFDLSETLTSSQSEDYYKFTLSSLTPSYSLYATLSGASSAVNFYLLKDDGAGSYTVVTLYPNVTSGTISLSSLGPGTYYLMVDRYSTATTSTSYSVHLETHREYGGNTQAAAYDIGSIGAVQTVMSGDWVGSADPTDYFKFTVRSEEHTSELQSP